MISKILTLTALVASAVAKPADHHEATSFAHFNDNHNSVHHIASAPQSYYHKPAPQQYHAAPAPQQYHLAQAPQHHHVAPAPQQYHHVSQPQVYHTQQPQVYHQAPQVQVYQHAQQHQGYHVQEPQVYHAAPAKLVLPAVTKIAVQAPYAQGYSAPSYAKALAAPVTKLALAAPVAKVVAPVAHYSHAPAHYHEEQYPDAHPKYEFAYLIQDGHTGDYHSQQEQRDGDHVVGQYSLHEADGTVRIVKYSDEGHGFNAVVERQGHPTEAPQHYKKVVVPVAKIAAPQYEHHY